MKVRKQPIVVDAWSYDPSRQALISPEIGGQELAEFLSVVGQITSDYPDFVPSDHFVFTDDDVLKVVTLEHKEGDEPLTVDHGDWVIRGVKGEFYPCKPDVFAQTYTEAKPGEQMVAVPDDQIAVLLQKNMTIGDLFSQIGLN